MTQNQKDLLKIRLEVAIQAFAKSHNLHLEGSVLKWEEWSTHRTFDITIRVDEAEEPE